jgi:hypothetical protein
MDRVGELVSSPGWVLSWVWALAAAACAVLGHLRPAGGWSRMPVQPDRRMVLRRLRKITPAALPVVAPRGSVTAAH